jgi:hypothetical protein
MNRFATRLAANLDHPIVAGCPARAPGTNIAAGIGAGIGAAAGSIGGGSALTAGIGAGLGVVVAYIVIWLRTRGGPLSISMGLVLTEEQLELYRLGMLNASKPQGLVRAIPYAEISDVNVRNRWFELIVGVVANSGALEVSTAKRGGGGETIDELRRRIAA